MADLGSTNFLSINKKKISLLLLTTPLYLRNNLDCTLLYKVYSSFTYIAFVVSVCYSVLSGIQVKV